VHYRLNIKDLSNPADLVKLNNAISELAFELDQIYTTTAPNGSISARIGTIALYNNSGTYTIFINTDGSTTWQQLASLSDSLWEIDGTETQLKTADEIDMQSKQILNLADPDTAQGAMTQAKHDTDFHTSTGHDHDGTDSKKVLYTNLDMTGTDLSKSELFADNGTFTVPAGVTKVYLTQVAGGGGGGGGNTNFGGGGGGGGAWLINFPVTVTPEAELAVQVGDGGAGGAAHLIQAEMLLLAVVVLRDQLQEANQEALQLEAIMMLHYQSREDIQEKAGQAGMEVEHHLLAEVQAELHLEQERRVLRVEQAYRELMAPE